MAAKQEKKSHANRRLGLEAVIVIGVLAAITLIMFGDTILAERPEVLSIGADMEHWFIHARAFGFDQLRNGNLALWNPYVYSGTPFFGNFQSALLYPPNVVFLLFDVRVAMNLSIALHAFAIGAFMYLWCRFRGLHPVASLMGGVLIMFCGPYFLHIMSGHMSNLCTMAWAPLLFLAIDGWFARRSLPWLGLGMLAVSMQVLAGHPQYVFFTAVAAGLYTLCHFVTHLRQWSRPAGVAAMYAGAVALTAVQLFAGVQANVDSVRTGGVPYEFAAETSLSPDNLLTFIAPKFFGDSMNSPYWGRSYVWEMSAFCGAVALALAVFAALRAERRHRRFLVLSAGVLLVLAAGSHTPLFYVMYHYVPGFGSFRAHGKFIFQVSLFVILLAAAGLDRLIRTRDSRRIAAGIVAGAGVLTGVAALWVYLSAGNGGASLWRDLMAAAIGQGERWVNPASLDNARYVQQAGATAATSLAWAAAFLCATAVLVVLTRRWAAAAFLIALLAGVEVFAFARTVRPTYEPDRVRSHPVVKRVYTPTGTDARFFDRLNGDRAVSAGVLNVWGYGPGVRKRHAQVIALTQGQDPHKVTQVMNFRRADRKALLAMLRIENAFIRTERGYAYAKVSNPMPRLNLIPTWRVCGTPDEQFQALLDEKFDPRRVVILEQDPGIQPAAAPQPGEVKLVESSTDHLVIEAFTPTPAILLVTDAYSSGWKAEALDRSDQSEYDLTPGNYCLQAIALKAGRHRIRLEYAPEGFRIGRWVSLIALAGYFLMWVGWLLRRRILHLVRRGSDLSESNLSP